MISACLRRDYWSSSQVWEHWRSRWSCHAEGVLWLIVGCFCSPRSPVGSLSSHLTRKFALACWKLRPLTSARETHCSWLRRREPPCWWIRAVRSEDSVRNWISAKTWSRPISGHEAFRTSTWSRSRTLTRTTSAGCTLFSKIFVRESCGWGSFHPVQSSPDCCSRQRRRGLRWCSILKATLSILEEVPFACFRQFAIGRLRISLGTTTRWFFISPIANPQRCWKVTQRRK